MTTAIGQIDPKTSLHRCPDCERFFKVTPPCFEEWPGGCLEEGCPSFAGCTILPNVQPDIGGNGYTFEMIAAFSSSADVHVYPGPKFDIDRAHAASIECWCGPRRDDPEGWHIVNHSG